MKPAATVKGVCPLCGPDYPHTAWASAPDFEYRTTGTQEFAFNKCNTCGVVVLDPRPDDGEIPRLYPRNYQPYQFEQLSSIARFGRRLVQRGKVGTILKHVRLGGTIVDVGCGNGDLLRAIRDEAPGRFNLVGWDYPGPHLDNLRTHGVQVIAAPIEDAHAPKGVDCFIMNQVLEHVTSPSGLLQQLGHSLRPGGLIHIETPDTSGLDARLFGRRHWGGYHVPRHMVLFDRTNLQRLVEGAGLQVIGETRLASPAFWIQSLHHWVSETRARRAARLFQLDNILLLVAFTAVDLLRAPFGPTSNQRLVAGKPT
jgi:2-polyprenyl-3-methyl-5-hydroxy-6-metoxy-1,4-benzoquinol methylase